MQVQTIDFDLEVADRNLRDMGESENAIVPDSDRIIGENQTTNTSASWSIPEMSTPQRKRRLDHHYTVNKFLVINYIYL